MTAEPLVRQLASALRGTGRKVYSFGLHFGYCPYTRGCYVDIAVIDGVSRQVPASCSKTCSAANAALEAAERWLAEQDALPLEVES